MNRSRLLKISILAVVLISAAAWATLSWKPQGEKAPKPSIGNVTIGVILGMDEIDTPTYAILACIAKEDINTYCEENITQLNRLR